MSGKLVIDQESCSACAKCAAIEGECFGLTEETEKACVVGETACSEERLQEAMDTCQAGAIKWIDW